MNGRFAEVHCSVDKRSLLRSLDVCAHLGGVWWRQHKQIVAI